MEMFDVMVFGVVMLIIGFGMGFGTVYFQVSKMGVCESCVCEYQRYMDKGCEYSPGGGWVCYGSGSIERVGSGGFEK